VDFAALQANERVIDVGCGTGAAAQYAAEAVGILGQVTGVDVNAGMLEVARSLPVGPGAPLEWREANAAQLPLDDESIDVVLCAQTLQFLPEKESGLSEMRRVVKPGGRVALSVWCEIEESPYFYTLVEAVARHIGSETAAGLKSAFALSDADEIRRLLKAAGFGQIEMTVAQLNLLLPKLAEFVPHHISATPMAAGYERADEPAQQSIIRDITETLSQYETNGHVQIPFKSHLIMTEK
jgi:ubiquinone/menaquinone biosynthesis C-methylase UbiE